MLVHQNNVGFDFRFAFLQRALDLREVTPAAGLAVGDQVNLFADGEPALERIHRLFEGRKHVCGPVGQWGLADDFAGEV